MVPSDLERLNFISKQNQPKHTISSERFGAVPQFLIGVNSLGIKLNGLERFKAIQNKIISLRVIPTVTSYYYIFVTNSDILCVKIWREREGQDNPDEI